MMVAVSRELLREFVDAAKKTAEYGLVLCGSGNLSWRVDDERMLITASGSWMAELSEDEVAICRIADCESLNRIKPSIEIGLHSGILRERRDVKVVLHFQSPNATTLACTKTQERDFSVIPEIPYYVGAIASVPYSDPGSEELAQKVTRAIGDHDLVLIQNHGQVTVGRDFREALQRAVFFELASSIVLRGGDQIQRLSDEAVAALHRVRKP
jgi:ribulose-5-phosphate 4-epimerase/fuculose-1-phosphate aldolase